MPKHPEKFVPSVSGSEVQANTGIYKSACFSPSLEDLRKMRILVVDDVPTNIILMRAMLEHGGFSNLVTAESGDRAIECLQKSLRGGTSDIDVILLDIIMPSMDGYSVCRRVRANEEWQDIPVIMITSENKWREETAQAAFDAGATDIMFKPIRNVELLPRVISALSLKRERDLRKQREHELESELAERKVVEARLQYLVGHDDLTGLYNRRRLEQALELAVIYARYYNRESALLYLDIDQFKVINDFEGHAAGDRLLVNVANRLKQQLESSDLFARIGSDEFALLIEDTSAEEAMKRAELLRHIIQNLRFETDHRTYQIGISIGVAMITQNEIYNTSDILARADQACFVAKSHGRNVVHMFSQEDKEVLTLHRDIHWVPLIRRALANDEFMLVYQPVLNVRERTVSHYEALIRMRGQNGELLPPGEFIPVAERMGLIHEIDCWVINHVVNILRDLSPEYRDLAININLSGHAFQDPSLLPLVKDRLCATGVAAERITFEITETATIANINRTRDMVSHLRAMGCRFALDDFGAGFNSYSYLKQFPVDYLKIDGTFVRNLPSDTTDQALVKSMIEIAHTLGKKTIAEFVESREILETLASYGIDYAQGYYIGKPDTGFAKPGTRLL